MAKPVTHFSRIRQIRGHTLTGTLCGRMISFRTASDDGINCTTDTEKVTCKLCIRELQSQVRRAA